MDALVGEPASAVAIAAKRLILSGMLSSPIISSASSLNTDEIYMHRCLELALRGMGFVAPNPMVGAVLVYQGRIIGEGYHQHYGQAHAEVNCLQSVKKEDEPLVTESVLYVSLEPCAHHGKTPPCADLIIQKRIPKVVVGCRDPFPRVDGKGIEKMRSAGIEVLTGVLETACRDINKRFLTFHTLHRPYIIVKWAQSADGRMASADRSRLSISHPLTNRLVHKWRSEESSILVGTNTALFDDPALTTRLWKGPDPIRIVIDMDLRLPSSLQLFDHQVKTIVFNARLHDEQPNLLYYQVTRDVSLVPQLLQALRHMNILSILVEGGPSLLQSFIDEDSWDEARIISNETMTIGNGIPAPSLPGLQSVGGERIATDSIRYFRRS